MKKITPFDAISFKNEVGDVIKPGDPIVIITKGMGNTGIKVGRYLGSRKCKGRYSRDVLNTVVAWDLVQERHVHKKSGHVYAYGRPEGFDEKEPVYPPSNTLGQWNTSYEERARLRDVYNANYTKYRELYNEWTAKRDIFLERNYKRQKVTIERRSTLQLNRIFPRNMALSKLAE